MKLPELQDFSLVGSTELDLLYDHHKSDEIDLFTTNPFDNEKIIKAIENRFKASFNSRSTNSPLWNFLFY
jgi:hypothetical protein